MYLQRNPAPEGHVTYFSFVTHRHSILDHACTSTLGVSHEEAVNMNAVPWDAWGPKATRWSGADEADAGWTSSVAGQRHIILAGERPQALRVRDFNTLTMRRALLGSHALMESPAETRDTVTVVGDESVTPHQGCFADDIRSSLPYVESITGESFDYDGVLIDEDHVIGLTVSRIPE
jgi:hypothetical protein